METVTDIEATEEKFALYSNLLFKLAMTYLGNRSDAQDAVQETFVKYITKSPMFTSPQHEKAWFIRVIINVCKDVLRSGWSKTIPIEQVDQIMGCFSIKEDSEIMTKILDLPQKYKSVIFLYYYQEYSVSEISNILHLTVASVKMRLNRARKQLKIQLERGIIND